jgi:hypothetical protein
MAIAARAIGSARHSLLRAAAGNDRYNA